MDDSNIENEVIDNSNAKEEVTSNIGVEKETTVNATGVKKKKRKRAKAKKKKNNGNFNAETESTDNVDQKTETANAEMKTTDNAINDTHNAETEIAENSEKGTIYNVNAEQEFLNNADPEQKILHNAYLEQEIPNKADPDQEVIDDADAEDDDGYLYDLSCCFVHNFERYLKRCYDIFNQRRSDVEEGMIDLPWDCKVLLRGSIGRYNATSYYNKYYPYSRLQNRYEALKAAFSQELIARGSITHAKFLHFSALYFFTSYDLRAGAGFEEAPTAAFDALVYAILQTKQKKIIQLWYPLPEG